MNRPATSAAAPPATLRAAVFGAGGGLGSAIVDLLPESPLHLVFVATGLLHARTAVQPQKS